MCLCTIPSNGYLHQECVQLSPGVVNAWNYNLLEGARASTGLSLLCVDLVVDLGYKQWSNDRPLCA